jgi:hypothetical protein
MSLTLMMVVPVKVILALSFVICLKRSRDTESVKWFQQSGKSEKFWESPGKQAKIAGLLLGRPSLFDLGPGVFE